MGRHNPPTKTPMFFRVTKTVFAVLALILVATATTAIIQVLLYIGP